MTSTFYQVFHDPLGFICNRQENCELRYEMRLEEGPNPVLPIIHYLLNQRPLGRRDGMPSVREAKIFLSYSVLLLHIIQLSTLLHQQLTAFTLNS